MNILKNRSVLIFTALMISAGATLSFAAAPAAAPQNSIVERGWTKRCAPADPKEKAPQERCEIFQKLEMAQNGMRVAEFGVGFPDAKQPGRGVVILPLGILLESGVVMKIDDGKPFKFKVRYCTKEGCVSYVNLEERLLSGMKKGTAMNFFFKTSDGHDVNLVMKLSGFSKALDEIL